MHLSGADSKCVLGHQAHAAQGTEPGASYLLSKHFHHVTYCFSTITKLLKRNIQASAVEPLVCLQGHTEQVAEARMFLTWAGWVP